MSRQTIQGYAVVGKKLGYRSFEVYGIGHDRPEAWRDAAETQTQGRLDAREMIERNPQMKCVEAAITVTFDKPEVQ